MDTTKHSGALGDTMTIHFKPPPDTSLTACKAHPEEALAVNSRKIKECKITQTPLDPTITMKKPSVKVAQSPRCQAFVLSFLRVFK